MAIVKVSNLKPGMVTKKPVLGSGDRVILGSGVTITERHIKLMKTWGVMLVDVEGEVEGVVGMKKKMDESELKKLREKMDKKFSRVLDNEIMMEIHRVAVKILIES
jgi:hypothetical protein